MLRGTRAERLEGELLAGLAETEQVIVKALHADRDARVTLALPHWYRREADGELRRPLDVLVRLRRARAEALVRDGDAVERAEAGLDAAVAELPAPSEPRTERVGPVQPGGGPANDVAPAPALRPRVTGQAVWTKGTTVALGGFPAFAAAQGKGVAGGDLTDAGWALVGPLLATARGRPGRENRRLLDGIPWRAREGARWRAIPGRCGRWDTVRRRFARWRDLGVFEAILAALAGSGAAEERLRMLDGTTIRAHHQHAAGAEGARTGRLWAARAGASRRRPTCAATPTGCRSPSSSRPGGRARAAPPRPRSRISRRARAA